MDLRAISIAAAAGTGYFAAVFAAGFALGILRVFALVPKLGEMWAVLAELPVMLLISWFACRWIVAKAQLALRISDRLIMGGTAFAVLMAAEIGISIIGFGRTIQDHFSHYTSVPVQLGLAGQLAFALFPVMQRR